MSFKLNPVTGELDYYQDKEEIEQFKVGDVIFNVTGENPATYLHYGTWIKISQGLAIIGAT